MSRPLDPGQQADLEILIDQHSLAGVLDAVAVICREKADHIRTEWQDPNTAREWDLAASRIDLTALKLTI